jgi:cytochrome c553
MLEKIVAIGCIGLIVTSSFLTTSAQSDDGQVPPEVVTLAKKASLGQVVFNHGNHITKNYNIEGTAPITCITCHHAEQPATEDYKAVYPSDRTVTLTAETVKDPNTPKVTNCQTCHLRKGDEPSLLTEIPKIKREGSGKTIVLNNRNAFHANCADCHTRGAKKRPEVKAPTAMKCMICHKRS